MARTIRFKVYKFSELDIEAQAAACENYRNKHQEFHWTDEWMESMKEGLKAFNASLKDWSIDYLYASGSWFKIDNGNDVPDEMTGLRLRKWLLNNFYGNFYALKGQGKYRKDERTGKWAYKRYSRIIWEETSCPFTGYIGDECFMDVFREFIKTPDSRNLDELLKDAVWACIKGLNEDCEHQLTDEYIGDHMEANNYEFKKDGTIF